MNPVSFNEHNYGKQKGPRIFGQSLFRLQNKFRKIPLLVLYYLTKFNEVLQNSFRVAPKTASANLCKPVDDMIKYSSFICLFESGNCRKEGTKLQRFEDLEERMELFKMK